MFLRSTSLHYKSSWSIGLFCMEKQKIRILLLMIKLFNDLKSAVDENFCVLRGGFK